MDDNLTDEEIWQQRFKTIGGTIDEEFGFATGKVTFCGPASKRLCTVRFCSRWIPILFVIYVICTAGIYTIAYELGYTKSAPYSKDTIYGSGSYFAGAIIGNISASFSQENDFYVNFTTVGADNALQQLLNKQVQFAVVDIAPPDSLLANYSLQILPILNGGQVLVFNWGGDIASLSFTLTRDVIVGIYNGSITTWDSPAIKNINPAVLLPSEPIIPLHRSDTSNYGAEQNLFLATLCSFNNQSWTKCNSTDGLPWPVENPDNMIIASNNDMIMAISSLQYSFGYIDAANLVYTGTNLSISGVVNIVSKAGQSVIATTTAIQEPGNWAQLGLNDFDIDDYDDDDYSALPQPYANIYDMNCSNCWPIETFSYVLYYQDILYKDCEHARAFEKLIKYFYGTDAEIIIEKTNNYAAMNDSIADDIDDIIKFEFEDCKGDSRRFNIYALSLVTGAIVTLICASFLILIGIWTTKLYQKSANQLASEERRPLVSAVEGGLNAGVHFSDEVFIQNEDLTFKEVIGKGAFSTVYSGVWRGTVVAIKKIHTSSTTFNSANLEKEIKLMSTLRHPNIVLFLFASVNPKSIIIVTELCQNGSLFDIIHKKKIELSWDRQLQMAIDAARGMLYLHERNPKIIHRDLKSSNLLVDKDWNVKVADFGISIAQVVEESRNSDTNVGTVEYMAPERLKNLPYDEKIDVYSFAIVLCELFTQQQVYPGMTVIQIRVMVKTQSLRPELPTFVPKSMRDLITAAWDEDPEMRPSFKDILTILLAFQESPHSLLDPNEISLLKERKMLNNPIHSGPASVQSYSSYSSYQ